MRALMFNADHLDDLGSARQTAATKERAPVHRLVGGHPAPALQRCISNHGDKYLRTLLIHDVSSLIRAVQMQATPSTNREDQCLRGLLGPATSQCGGGCLGGSLGYQKASTVEVCSRRCAKKRRTEVRRY